MLDHRARDAVDLRGRERLVRLGRRHDLFLVVRLDTLDQRALVGLARDDRRRAVLALRRRVLEAVQPQLGLARPRIQPVAGVAIVGEDRLDVLVERQGGRRARGLVWRGRAKLGEKGGDGTETAGTQEEGAQHGEDDAGK